MSLKEISQLESIELAYEKAQSSWTFLKYNVLSFLDGTFIYILVISLLLIEFVIGLKLYLDAEKPEQFYWLAFVGLIELLLLFFISKSIESYKNNVLISRVRFLGAEDLKELKGQKSDLLFILDSFLSNQAVMQDKKSIQIWMSKFQGNQEKHYFDLRATRKNKFMEALSDSVFLGLVSIVLGLISIATSFKNGKTSEGMIYTFGFLILILTIVVIFRFSYILVRNKVNKARNKYFLMKIIELKLDAV